MIDPEFRLQCFFAAMKVEHTFKPTVGDLMTTADRIYKWATTDREVLNLRAPTV